MQHQNWRVAGNEADIIAASYHAGYVLFAYGRISSVESLHHVGAFKPTGRQISKLHVKILISIRYNTYLKYTKVVTKSAQRVS